MFFVTGHFAKFTCIHGLKHWYMRVCLHVRIVLLLLFALHSFSTVLNTSGDHHGKNGNLQVPSCVYSLGWPDCCMCTSG